jgi:uncharacterized protein YcbK (DUF882 family)
VSDSDDRVRELEQELEAMRQERDRALAARDALIREVLPVSRPSAEGRGGGAGKLVVLALVVAMVAGFGYVLYRNQVALSSLQSEGEVSPRRVAKPRPTGAPAAERPAGGRGIEVLPIVELAHLGRAALAPDGRTLALADASDGGGLLLVTLAPGGALHASQTRHVRAHQAAVRDLAFSRDGSRLVSAGADGALRVWDRKGGAERTLRRSGSGLFAVVAGRSLCASAGEGPQVLVHALDGKGPARTLTGHRGWIRALALDGTEGRLASGGHDTTILIHRTTDGTVERSLKGHRLWVSALAFSPDGKRLASAGWDNRILLWELEGDGRPPTRLRGGPVRAVTSLVFSRDGALLAAGSFDRSITLFDVAIGKRRSSLEGHRYQVQSVLLDREGRALFSSSGDGTVRRWPLPPIFPPVTAPLPPAGPGEVTLRNNTSGERARIRLLDGGRVLPAGARALARFLRCGADDRGDTIDKGLLRLLDAVADRFGRSRELVIVSGYRSPEYNRLRRKQSREVAKESQHVEGKAIDLRVEGVTIMALRDFLKSQRKGGVGFYPDSNFVHMDVGRVRSWSGE